MFSKIIEFKFKGDHSLLIVSIILTIFGLLMIFSASATIAYFDREDTFYYFNRQIVWITLGIILGIFFYKVNLKKIKSLAFLLLIASYGFMLFMLPEALSPFNSDGTKLIRMPFVVTLNGATRWYNFGAFSFQPSELFKLALILCGAFILSREEKEKLKIEKLISKIDNENYKTIMRLLLNNLFSVITIIGCLLILPQRDLDTLIVIVLIYLSLIFVYTENSIKISKFVITVIVFSFFGLILILAEDFRRARLAGFFEILLKGEPSREFREGISFQFWNGLIAMGSGGLLGLGYGESRQKLFFLQDAAFTDSIFTIIGEEFGLFGTLTVILLFLFLVSKGIEIARNSKDKLFYFLSIGITSFIGFQAFLNISANLGIIPFAGMALPFFTYGGSNTIVVLGSIGILLNLSSNINNNKR